MSDYEICLATFNNIKDITLYDYELPFTNSYKVVVDNMQAKTFIIFFFDSRGHRTGVEMHNYD